jgi:hypothetical protein
MYFPTCIYVNLFAVLFGLSNIADGFNYFAIYLIFFKFVNLAAALFAFFLLMFVAQVVVFLLL